MDKKKKVKSTPDYRQPTKLQSSNADEGDSRINAESCGVCFRIKKAKERVFCENTGCPLDIFASENFSLERQRTLFVRRCSIWRFQRSLDGRSHLWFCCLATLSMVINHWLSIGYTKKK